MTRHGKIARLPCEIREKLNVRLQNGEVGKQLVEWLNSLPEVQVILAAQFGGRPVNEQNLSDWKQGGFEDWLRHKDDCAHARMLTEYARELEKEAGEVRLEDRLAAPMVMALARLMREIEAEASVAEKQKALLALARELTQIRRVSHEAERVRLKRERWETEQAKAEEEKRIAAESSANWQKTLRAYFPEFFDGRFRNPSGGFPEELRTCLEASERLRKSQNGSKGSSNGTFPRISPNQSS